MAIGTTAADRAKIILSIFKDHSVRAGEVLIKGAVNKQYLLGGGLAPDFNVGLEFAVAQGWIVVEPNRLRLTNAGFAAL